MPPRANLIRRWGSYDVSEFKGCDILTFQKNCGTFRSTKETIVQLGLCNYWMRAAQKLRESSLCSQKLPTQIIFISVSHIIIWGFYI